MDALKTNKSKHLRGYQVDQGMVSFPSQRPKRSALA